MNHLARFSNVIIKPGIIKPHFLIKIFLTKKKRVLTLFLSFSSLILSP